MSAFHVFRCGTHCYNVGREISFQQNYAFPVGPVHNARDPQVLYSVKKTLKLGHTVLLTYLKIILLQYFQFLIISGIQTDPKFKDISKPLKSSA